MVTGTFQFEGIDDFVSTDPILNSTDGPFSVFAWIQGGAPGQAIISQTGDFGGTWLGIDPTEGKLMTGFSGMYFGVLVSETVITDGQWHHVGFVWDGSYRSLYVDGVEVAKDATAQNPLKYATGGLYIGTSKDLEAGAFFSGLIDDVRIYDRALNQEQIAELAQ